MAWHAGTGLPAPYIAAIEEIAAHLAGQPGMDAVLLQGSWARGKGNLALGGDCDLVLLHSASFDRTKEGAALADWLAARQAVWQLDTFGPYAGLDLKFHDRHFAPTPRGWTSGPDEFELEIGNLLAYALPVVCWTDAYEQLRARWLPFYGEDLRAERLAEALKYARNDLDHIPPYSRRGLYFQCLKRLHHAIEETLQTLFIAARRYPLAYDKWVEEQVSDILGRPELYATLTQIVTIPHLDAATLCAKAALLASVVDTIVP